MRVALLNNGNCRAKARRSQQEWHPVAQDHRQRPIDANNRIAAGAHDCVGDVQAARQHIVHERLMQRERQDVQRQIKRGWSWQVEWKGNLSQDVIHARVTTWVSGSVQSRLARSPPDRASGKSVPDPPDHRWLANVQACFDSTS